MLVISELGMAVHTVIPPWDEVENLESSLGYTVRLSRHDRMKQRAASHLIVPASSGLKAYNQSFMSLSLRACRRTPRCFVHTAKVLGVWKETLS